MASSLVGQVRRLLQDAAGAEGLTESFERSFLEECRQFLLRQVSRSKTPKEAYRRVHQAVAVLTLLLGVVGAALGFVTTGFQNKEAAYALWGGFLVVGILLAVFYVLLPHDVEDFHSDLARLRFLRLLERLAAQLTVFARIHEEQERITDDQAIIDQVSEWLPNLESMSEEHKEVVRLCLEDGRRLRDVDTRIELSVLAVDRNVLTRLDSVARSTVELCNQLFTGRDLTAKIYLRSRTVFEGKTVEVLASVAKFPPDSDPGNRFGGSWIKIRGNPSIVWECLEKYEWILRGAAEFNPTYQDTLSIPLTGRIGVLSITSSDKSTFNPKDKNVFKTLLVSTNLLVVQAISHSPVLPNKS